MPLVDTLVGTYNKNIKKYKRTIQAQVQTVDTNGGADNPSTATDTADAGGEANKPNTSIDIQQTQMQMEERTQVHNRHRQRSGQLRHSHRQNNRGVDEPSTGTNTADADIDGGTDPGTQ